MAMKAPSPAVHQRLQVLGYGGLIPFAALAVGAHLVGDSGLSVIVNDALTIYAITILSFVGAISWGIALADDQLHDSARARLLLFSVMPSLMSWLAWFLPGSASRYLGLAALTVLVFLLDQRHGAQFQWPAEWLKLRRNLSLIVAACLVLAAAAPGNSWT